MGDKIQHASRGNNPGPLNTFAGIRVVDFTHVLAGPACSYYLSLMGAEVIKLESAYRGDGIRHRGGTAKDLAEDEMSTSYLTQGAGKRSLAVDLGKQEGKSIALQLIAGCDVLVENHRPETLRRLGLDYQTLSQDHPRLIYCALTGYGQNGPKGNHAAYDVNIQAASGIMAITGTPETGPLRTGAPIMDYGTGLAAAFAVASALFARGQTQRGTFIDISMLEVAFNLMSSSITDYTATGNAPQPRGNAANSRSPAAGSFQTADGLISLGVNEEHQFAALCNAIEKPQWLEDSRFSNRKERDANRESLLSELESVLATRPADEWEVVLGDAGVPVARVNTLPEALASSQTISREALHCFEVDRFPGRTAQVPTLPFLFNGRRPAPNLPPPRRGEHSIAILKEIGISKTDIDRLIAKGIVEQPE